MLRETWNRRIFRTSEVESVDVVDRLQRAISMLQENMAKNRVSLQKKINTRNLKSVIEALTVVIDGAAFSSVDRSWWLFGRADKQALVANVHSRQASDGELSNPAASTYVSHSSGIVNVFNEKLEKAQTTLAVPSPLRRTISQCSSSNLSISWHRTTRPWRRGKRTMWSLPLRWRQAEEVDFAEAEKIFVFWPQARAVVVVWPHKCSVADASQVLQNEMGTAEADTFIVPGKFSCQFAHHERF